MLAFHGFEVDECAFATVFPPVDKTQDELKKACKAVMAPGEAGLMATHVELQSLSRANFIGASPTLAYSSIGNVSRHKYLVNLIAVVQDMADVDPVRLDPATFEIDHCFSVPPPPRITQAELLIQEVLDEWAEPVQTVKVAHLAARCHNPPLHAYWSRRPNETQQDADRLEMIKYMSSKAGKGTTVDTLETFLSDHGRVFPAVIATLVANGYKVGEARFSRGSDIAKVENSPADQAAAWQELANQLRGCLPAVDFDFQQKVSINGYRGDGCVELTQNSGLKQTANLLFQWRLVEAAFEECHERMAEITAKQNRGKSAAAKAKKPKRKSSSVGEQDVMIEIYDRYEHFINKAENVLVSASEAPTVLSDTPRVPVTDVKLDRHTLRDEFGLENISALPKGKKRNIAIGEYFRHLKGGEQYGPPGDVKGGGDKKVKQNILDEIAKRMDIIRNKVQNGMLQTIVIAGDVTIWHRDYTHEFERRRVLGEASLVERHAPSAWMQSPRRPRQHDGSENWYDVDGIGFWDILHFCTQSSSYGDPKARWVRDQKIQIALSKDLPGFTKYNFKEAAKYDKLGTFTCGKAPEYIFDEDGVESYEDHTLTPFTDPSGSKRCEIGNCGGLLPGSSAPLYIGYECKSCAKGVTKVSTGCCSSAQVASSWAICQDCVLKKRSKMAFSPWGANHARVHQVAAEWTRLQQGGLGATAFAETLLNTQIAQQGTLGWRLTDEWRHISLSCVVSRSPNTPMDYQAREEKRMALKDAKVSADSARPVEEDEAEDEAAEPPKGEGEGEGGEEGGEEGEEGGEGGDNEEGGGDEKEGGDEEEAGDEEEGGESADRHTFGVHTVTILKELIGDTSIDTLRNINKVYQLPDTAEEEPEDESGNAQDDIPEDDDDDEGDEGAGASAGSQEEFWFPSNISYQAALDYVNSFFLSGRNNLEITHAPQPILRPFTPFKWIWVDKYKRRLWYSERAELFHPMFRKVMTKNMADAFADSGMLGVLQKIFGELEQMRPGGYTCNLCSKRVEPTKIVKFSMKKYASKGEQVLNFPGASIAATATGDESRIERLCQGYFCHHKEIDASNLKTLQRCYAVCMECSQSSVVQGGDITEDLAEDPARFDIAFKGRFSRITGANIAADQIVRVEPLGADGANLDEAAVRRASFSKGTAEELKVTKVGPRTSFMARQGYLFANGFDENWEATEKLRESLKKKTMFGRTEGGPKQYKAAVDALLKQFMELDPANADAYGLTKANIPKLAAAFFEDFFAGQDTKSKAVKSEIALKRRAVTDMRRFAIQLGSYIYSSEPTAALKVSAWHNHADTYQEKYDAADDRVETQKAKLDLVPHGNVSKHDAATQKLMNLKFAASTIADRLDPLANKEVPMNVRNVVNALYPMLTDEVGIELFGVSELDLLFEQAIIPLDKISRCVDMIATARSEALKATGKLEGIEMSANITECMKSLRKAIKERETAPKPNTHDPSKSFPPEWCPPRLREAIGLGEGGHRYVALKLSRHHLLSPDDNEESQPEGAFPENADLLDAVEKLEVFWNLNMQLYKGIALQRKYVMFLSACMVVDKDNFAKLIEARYPQGSPNFNIAKDALTNNVQAINNQVKGLSDVLKGCSIQTAAMNSEISVWRKEWLKEKANKAPNTIAAVVPFIVNLAGAASTQAARNAKVADVIQRCSVYYPPKTHKKAIKGNDLVKFVSLIQEFCKGDLQLTEYAKVVVDAYYPHPMLEKIDFDDAFADDLNELFAAAGSKVTSIVDTIKKMDISAWKIQDACNFAETKGAPSSIKAAFQILVDSAKKAAKLARVYYFQGVSTPPTYEVVALMKEDNSMMGKLKSAFGMTSPRVALPNEVQEAVKIVEAGLSELRVHEMTLKKQFAELKKIKNDIYVEWLEGSSQETVGGETRLTQDMKAENHDAPVIKDAGNCAKGNQKNLSSCASQVQAYIASNPTTRDLQAGMRLFKRINDKTTSLKEHLRTKKVPQTKGTIADFVALTLFPEQADASHRTEAEMYMKEQLIAQTKPILAEDDDDKRPKKKPSKRGSISTEMKVALNVPVWSPKKRRDLARWLISICLQRFPQELAKPRARSSSLTRASGIANDGEEFAGFGDDAAGDLNENASTKTSKKVYKKAVTEATALIVDPKKRKESVAGALAEFDKTCAEEDRRDKVEKTFFSERIVDPTPVPIPVAFWGDSFSTFFNVVGIDEFPVLKLTRVPKFDQTLVAACKPFAEVTRIVNENRTLYSQFMAKARPILPASRQHLMSNTTQATQIVVHALHEYFVGCKLAIESQTQDLQLNIAWAKSSFVPTGNETPETLVLKMLNDVRVDDSEIKANVNPGAKIPKLSKKIQEALAALAVLIRSLAPPGQEKATTQIKENHKKLEVVCNALHGMSHPKAKRATILETPLELLDLPPVQGNLLAPYPNVNAPQQLSLPALSSMVATPTPSFALRAIRQSYCHSVEVAVYAVESDKEMSKHGILKIPSSDFKGIAKDEIASVLGHLKENPLVSFGKLAKFLNLGDKAMEAILPPEPTMAAIYSIYKTYKLCKAAWSAGNLIRGKMIQRGAATAASNYKMAHAQHVEEIITSNRRELDDFVKASDGFKSDMSTMLHDVVENARTIQEMIYHFQAGDLIETKKVKRSGMFGGAKDFVFGKKKKTFVTERESRVLTITLPEALLHLDNPH